PASQSEDRDAESMVRQAHHDTLSLSKGWIPAGVYPALRCGAGMTNCKDYVYTPKLSFEEYFN
ncbi:MAG: hypothetical protein NT055_06565, partial [Nitrospirae bacterium]|nr:hypothetical protein [Nitrospirota bacterium]